MTRYGSAEARVFVVATLVALVHAVDDAFVHRGPGLGLGQHAPAAAISIVAAIAGIAVFPSLRPGLRAALAFTFGGLACVNGMLHVFHVAEDGPAGGDPTGILALAAGAVLIGLAASILWRRRGEAMWRSRVVAVAAGLLLVIVVLGPVGLGMVETHKWREPIGSPPSAAYRDIAFHSSDGLRLAGWYRPSRNGAAVLVVHGGGSDRTGAVDHAEMLARHGYGVLVYDARGRGESEGGPNGFGWDWRKDVDGALAVLKRQPDVDADRIGALGLSTGADVLIEAAPGNRDLAAIVADGAAAESFEDWHRLRGTDLGLPSGWVMFTTIRVLSGDPPGPPLEDRIARLRAPALLISAGEDVERDFNVLYEKVGNPAVEHWNLPEAHHTNAIHEYPRQYERRVVTFFDKELT